MAKPKRLTLADVAKYTGLSTATVSLALNNRPGSRIPEATAARVREAAAELGYVPDAMARSLRTGQTSALGFVSDEVTVTRFASAMVRGILDAADEQDYVVMIMETGHRKERLAEAFSALRARRVDGLLVGLMASRRVQLPASKASVPRIVVNGLADGCTCVLPDEFEAGRAAVRYLIDRGHRRIAMIGAHTAPPPPEVSVNIGVRLAGIDDAMAEAGLSFVDRHDGTVWEPELGYQGGRAVFERDNGATAILAANDRIAFGVYQAAQDSGVSIPADVSVLSFDDEQLASMVRPPLTSMRLPYQEMGTIAVARLLQAVRGDDDASHAPEQVLVPLTMIERESVQTI